MAEVVNDRKNTGIATDNDAPQQRDGAMMGGLEDLTGRMLQMEGTMKKLQRVVVRHIKEASA